MKKYFVAMIMLVMMGTVIIAQDSQGFFLNNHSSQKAIIPSSIKIKTPTVKAIVKVEVDVADTIATVSEYLFGNNTNQWMGQIITETVLMEHLKTLSPNILRYPGGNISNVFFWDASPNHFPKDLPNVVLYGDKEKHSTRYFFEGKDSRPSAFSLDNYYKLLQQTNSTGTICVNAGYARYGTGNNPIATAAHYAANWVRYDKGRTRFWEVGNEDYGTWQAGYKIDTTKNKDDQPEITNGELYGKIFKVFSDSMKFAARETGTKIYIGATIIELPKNKKTDKEVDRIWNSGFFKSAKNAADFFVIHSYYTPYEKDSKPDEILLTATTVTNKMMQYMKNMAQQNNVLLKPVALTEWNIFAEGSKQQTSYINGMHAAIVLGELIKNRYGMACRWDLANGYANGNDHGLFNKGDEPGVPKWNPRPAYYYLYYFQKYFGNKMMGSLSSDENVIVYASSFSDGKKGLVLINKDTSNKTISIHFNHQQMEGKFYGHTLTGGNDNGLFSQKVLINGVEPSLPAGGPDDFENIKAWSSSFKNEVNIALPARAVQYILVD